MAKNGSIDIAYTLVTAQWAADTRAQGYPIYAWTANSAADWTRLTGKVDVISTDAAKAFATWRMSACTLTTRGTRRSVVDGLLIAVMVRCHSATIRPPAYRYALRQ